MKNLTLVRDEPFEWPEVKIPEVFYSDDGEFYTPKILPFDVKRVYLKGLSKCLRGKASRLSSFDKEVIREYLFEYGIADTEGPYSVWLRNKMFIVELRPQVKTESVLITFSIDGMKQMELEILT
jgi:hypothetical protein